ncbi:GPW/gp25 family protein [Dickeya sp. Secpp 1600]|uniref:GPW/gp25 family protein n=1 Tax=Dickeya sp. Secpp 1600 TaxID=2037915 RepID=UPI000D315E88|nr:GPW/gp25 family protein [Dickeya sp. Secpp 1600]
MDDSHFLGRGWQFPPVFSGAVRQVAMNSAEANINQSIDLILQTQRGERSLLPYFGSELRSFLFRYPDATLQNEIAQSVRTTLLNDEPRISVASVEVTFLPEPASMVAIHIDYIIRQTNTRHNHVFPFSLLEGTNLTVEQQGAHQR